MDRDRHDPELRFPRTGAHCSPEGVELVVWAPGCDAAEVMIDGPDPASPHVVAMQRLDRPIRGYHRALVAGLRAGARYRYRLDGGDAYPDPCSRLQPEGPHGPSEVVATDFPWTDAGWPGLELAGQVLYELHIGTFTAAGTFDAAAEYLPRLRDLGITAVEILPVAECAGRWNWGYDGVALYAPSHHYGGPLGLKRFVDRAHALGLGVVLDVVYNHLGPDGNYLKAFAAEYFTDRYATEWGEALNYDGEGAGGVREYILQNACQWVDEFHLDGLRLDATQSIHDHGPRHLLAELAERTRKAAAPRRILLISENEPQHATHLLPEDRGGYGLDAMWNDDFHHTACVAVTGRRHAYYHDYGGTAQELISSARRGFLFQGQYYPWQKQTRGHPLRTAAATCITFLQNHDQVANSITGARLHALVGGARYRALTALWLLSPQTPMFFMGQEFNASSPFLYFADHKAGLREAVATGRREFLEQFPGARGEEAGQRVADPADPATFTASRLHWDEWDRQATALDLHRDLLALRRTDPLIRRQDATRLDGAVLGPQALVLRWFAAQEGEEGDETFDRLLVVNLGTEIPLGPVPEPLLAPGLECTWKVLWSSEDFRYGGMGRESPMTDQGWFLPAESAVLLAAKDAP